jgi:hypothetical protein
MVDVVYGRMKRLIRLHRRDMYEHVTCHADRRMCDYVTTSCDAVTFGNNVDGNGAYLLPGGFNDPHRTVASPTFTSSTRVAALVRYGIGCLPQTMMEIVALGDVPPDGEGMSAGQQCRPQEEA